MHMVVQTVHTQADLYCQVIGETVAVAIKLLVLHPASKPTLYAVWRVYSGPGLVLFPEADNPTTHRWFKTVQKPICVTCNSQCARGASSTATAPSAVSCKQNLFHVY